MQGDRSAVFIAAVLAFCAGIYLEAAHPLSLPPLLAASAASILAIAVFRLFRKAAPLLVPLILLCSLSLGAARLAMVQTEPVPAPPDQESTIFDGLVTESSSHIKVLSLERPIELKGMRAAFVTDAEIDTSQRVRLFGKMIDLAPTFQNPGGSSWKWQKRLEGVTYEIKGRLLSKAAGTDPVAIDAYVAKAYWDLEPDALPYLAMAAERGLGTVDYASLNVKVNQLS